MVYFMYPLRSCGEWYANVPKLWEHLKVPGATVQNLVAREMLIPALNACSFIKMNIPSGLNVVIRFQDDFRPGNP